MLFRELKEYANTQCIKKTEIYTDELAFLLNLDFPTTCTAQIKCNSFGHIL